MGGEKQKILQAKAALYNEFPKKEINYYNKYFLKKRARPVVGIRYTKAREKKL